MEITRIEIGRLVPYPGNAKRHPREQIEQIKRSISEFGNNDPIAVDEDMVVIEGHGRLAALRELGYDEADCIVLTGLTDAQKAAYRIVHNQLTMNTDWDVERLKEELDAMSLDLSEYGLDDEEIRRLEDELVETYGEGEALDESRESLKDRFVVPPFSVLDTKAGEWQDRKRLWKAIVRSGEGRKEDLMGGLRQLAVKTGSDSLTGTSIFDPVLCEVLINWFCPPGGSVLDPFAGGSVRGLVSALLGRGYTGVDLRPEQIEANERNLAALGGRPDLLGGEMRRPRWIVGDSANIRDLAPGEYDFILSCPPYADLEQYSDDPRDLSNMGYEEFLSAYREIVRRSCEMLREGSFAAWVVGDVRGTDGAIRGFVPDTIRAFEDAGLRYYNEIVLLNALATAPVRAGRVFGSGRKVVKVHQNVLVFVKGDWKEAAAKTAECSYDLPEEGGE